MRWWEIVGFVFVMIFLFTSAVGGVLAAPWVPTRKRERQTLSALPFQAGDRVVDLGCGDGGILRTIVAAHPNVSAHGVDIALFPLMIGWIRKILAPRRFRNVHLHWGNLFSWNCHDADWVIIFLLPKSYPRILKKFSRELRPSAMIIVEAWVFPTLTPIQTLTTPGGLSLFLYRAQDLRNYFGDSSGIS